MKLFTAEKESSCKTAVSFDTHLVVIACFGHHHLEYFIQDVDGDVFDRVIGHVRVSTHRSPKKEFYWGNCKKVSNIFLLIDVCLCRFKDVAEVVFLAYISIGIILSFCRTWHNHILWDSIIIDTENNNMQKQK